MAATLDDVLNYVVGLGVPLADARTIVTETNVRIDGDMVTILFPPIGPFDITVPP